MKSHTLPIVALLLLGGLASPCRAAEEASPASIADKIPLLGVFRDYLDLIERYNRLANDPTAAAVAAVIGTNEVLKAKGPDEAIKYFTDLLPDVKNQAVQRAIHIQLADLYRTNGQPEQAIGQLRVLILSAPPSNPGSAPR